MTNTLLTNIIPAGVFIFVLLLVIAILTKLLEGIKLSSKDLNKTTASLSFFVLIIIPFTIAGIVYIILKFK